MDSLIQQYVRAAVRKLGFDIVRYRQAGSGNARYGPVDPKCEGFDRFLREAESVGADVNDWIELTLGWEPAIPALESAVFPYLRDDSVVCEIGPGTGRHARHILTRVPKGQLHLFDHSTWLVSFLREYFSPHESVRIHPSMGDRISMPESSVDLCFSNGTFIEMKLGTIFLYAHEFHRVLREGGYAIFDYVDITRPEGWAFLDSRSGEYSGCFTYHATETLDKLFDRAGFESIARYPWGKSTFVVYRKK